MSSEYSVEQLVPHSGSMSLLSRICDYGEDWLTAEVDISEQSMFANSQGVPAWIGMEYLAQAIGAYAGLQRRRQGSAPKIGFLVGARKYQCTKPLFRLGQTLELKVSKELEAENGLSTFYCQLQGEDISASVSINVFQPENPEQFIKENS